MPQPAANLSIAFALAVAFVSPSCQAPVQPLLLGSTESSRPVLVGKQDVILFECTFFSAPDDFELLKNTSKNHVAGVFTPEDGARLLERLKRHRKFECMSTPTVTARQGQSAKVEIIQEFIYPTEFDPPEVGKSKPGEDSFPVTPTTPTAFSKKDVGLTAAFTGRRAAGGGVDCEFDISEINFLGFVNYGSPITTPGKTKSRRPAVIILTENKIEQPVFASKRLASRVTLPNGHYLAVGGLRRVSQPNLRSRTLPSPSFQIFPRGG